VWTIDDLGRAVEAALAHGYEGAASARVRDVPDRRTIRYYTTLGLIDRPASMRGRTALYGERHLLQLVAIKRLQARGLSLAEVQAELAGLSTKRLRDVARIPEGFSFERASDLALAADETQHRRDAFWGSLPSDETTETATHNEHEALPMNVAESDDGEVRPSALLQGVRLGDDVILLLSSGRAIDGEDVRALEKAARPLLRLLEARGLTKPRDEER
jgi:DNA-binding transcriptional MerR regulator